MNTLLVAPEELARELIEIRGEAYVHLFRARRLAVGDELHVVDGQGLARRATVERIGPRDAQARLGEPAPAEAPLRRVSLLIAAPKLPRASWLVEKATELGVSEIHFIASERSPRSYGPGNLARLARVAAAALEQCHGTRLPKVAGIHPWGEVPAHLAGATVRRFLDTAAAPAPPSMAPADAVALLIGPEGGWTNRERETLLGWGVEPWCLGSRVLRVETAAVAAAALVLFAR